MDFPVFRRDTWTKPIGKSASKGMGWKAFEKHAFQIFPRYPIDSEHSSRLEICISLENANRHRQRAKVEQ
jgi:hypothetical protein